MDSANTTVNLSNGYGLQSGRQMLSSRLDGLDSNYVPHDENADESHESPSTQVNTSRQGLPGSKKLGGLHRGLLKQSEPHHFLKVQTTNKGSKRHRQTNSLEPILSSASNTMDNSLQQALSPKITGEKFNPNTKG